MANIISIYRLQSQISESVYLMFWEQITDRQSENKTHFNKEIGREI